VHIWQPNAARKLTALPTHLAGLRMEWTKTREEGIKWKGRNEGEEREGKGGRRMTRIAEYCGCYWINVHT